MRVFVSAGLAMSAGAASDLAGTGARGRLLNHYERHIVCPSGYVDHTQNTGTHWKCAVDAGCPGDYPWADVMCSCACVRPSDCLTGNADDSCVVAWEWEVVKKLLREGGGPTPAPAPAPHQSRYPELDTPAPAPRAAFFLQGATTSPPPDAGSDGLKMHIVIVIVVVLAVLACFVSCVACISSEADEPSTHKVYPMPVPEVLSFQGAGPSLSMPAAPLPNLLGTQVQPKAAWLGAKDEDCLSNVSTRSPRSSLASSRSSAHSSQPSNRLECGLDTVFQSPRASPRSPLPSTRSTAQSYESSAQRRAPSASPRHAPSASLRPGAPSPRFSFASSQNRLTPIPVASLSPSPRNSDSASRLPSPHVHGSANKHSSPHCSSLR